MLERLLFDGSLSGRVVLLRLRNRVATNPRPPDAATSRAEAVFEKAEDLNLGVLGVLNLQKVKSPPPTTAENIFNLPSRSMVSWVFLDRPSYACTLPNAFEAITPRALSVLWQKLVAILRDFYPKLPDHVSVQWPVVIAGVAAATGDGAVEDQDFIAPTLDDIWRRLLSDSTP